MATLYLKYRPQKFDDLDLASVRESLKATVKSDKIPHAYLFSGPKGTGKTSAARILAKVINCSNIDRRKKDIEPCNKCASCKAITAGTSIDVIEMDAASHRGIDDIRALREAVKLAPANSPKKVYIIDESHMLTTEAANALLKTLEEPPAHVMFVLATTNPEKLPDTIRSRATGIVFKKATKEEIVRSLKRKVRGEKVKAEEDALSLIAESADGSFRDADKILEQIIAESKPLNTKTVEKFINKTSTSGLQKFIDSLVARNTKEAIEFVERYVRNGGMGKNLANQSLEALRKSMLAKVGIGEDTMRDLDSKEVNSLIELFVSVSEKNGVVVEQLPLELAIVKWCGADTDHRPTRTPGSDGSQDADEDHPGRGDHKENAVEIKAEIKPQQKETEELNFSGKINEKDWQKVLTKIRPTNSSTEALLRASKPIGIEDGTLTLAVFYRFHKEKLEENAHRMLLEDACTEVLGSRVRVECMLTQPPAKKVIEEVSDNVVLSEKSAQETVKDPLTAGEDDDIIKAAKEIFGT